MPIHRPSFFLFFSLTIKDKTKISHLEQGSFTHKVRTIFTLKIIVSIFVKLFLILVLHLRQFFIVRIFVKRATGQVTVHLADRWSIKKFKLLKQHNSNKCVHKKEKGNKSGQLETIRMILNAGNGKFIGGLLFMASLMYGVLPIDL